MSEQRDPERPLAGVRGRVSDKLGNIWWAFMTRGVLAAALAFAPCSGPAAA